MSALFLSAATAAFTLVAVALTALAGLGWRRSGATRQGILTLGFAAFALSGLVSSGLLFRDTQPLDLAAWTMASAAVGLLFIYVAAVKR